LTAECPRCQSHETYYTCQGTATGKPAPYWLVYCLRCRDYTDKVSCKDFTCGQMCKKDCDDMRMYEVNGQKLPSVTSLLALLPEAPELAAWKRNTVNFQEVSEKAMVVGTITHFRIENDLARKHGLPLQKLTLEAGKPTPDDEMRAKIQLNFDRYLAWYEEIKPVPIVMEKTVWNEPLGYAGTLDMLATVGGKVHLIDIKTGKGMYDKYYAQCWAYREALSYMGVHVDTCSVLRIGSNGLEFAQDLNVDMYSFMMFEALEIYQKRQGGKKGK